MVKIRLSRGGTKKRPFFHVVATNSRSSRDGKYIERLGFFNPSALDHEEDIRIDLERVKYWESQGAILSDRVRSLIKLLAVDREQRRAQRAEKINKKKIARKEKKLQETPAEEPAAETKAEPEAAEETPAEEGGKSRDKVNEHSRTSRSDQLHAGNEAYQIGRASCRERV